MRFNRVYRPFSQVDSDWGKMSESLRIDDLTVSLVRLEVYIRLAAKFTAGWSYDAYKHIVPSWYVFHVIYNF